MSRKFLLTASVLAMLALVLSGASAMADNASSKKRVAKSGDTVEINYTGKLEDNTVFDSTKDRGPFKFKLGSQNIISGINKAVTGMKLGEKKTVTIPPADAYGNYNKKLLRNVSTKELPPGIFAGARLVDPSGQPVTVKEIRGNTTVLDGNHILAGKTLIFEIELVNIL